MADSLPRPLRIIDVGGTEQFWEQMGFANEVGVEITLLNLRESKVKNPGFNSVAGDAREMKQFNDRSFDIAFSNSVIEHVGTFDDQTSMAKEMQRIGKCIFLQTPNRYFPVEPHFLFPYFQLLPLGWRTRLLQYFNLGWYKRTPDAKKARSICSSIRLLKKKELLSLFPEARLHKEKFFGFTKSFVVTT